LSFISAGYSHAIRALLLLPRGIRVHSVACQVDVRESLHAPRKKTECRAKLEAWELRAAVTAVNAVIQPFQ